MEIFIYEALHFSALTYDLNYQSQLSFFSCCASSALIKPRVSKKEFFSDKKSLFDFRKDRVEHACICNKIYLNS